MGGSSVRVIYMGIGPEEANEIQTTDNVVYIYDGLKRWWADHRIKEWLVAAFILGLSLGVVIGLIAGHVLASACSVLSKSTLLYRELVSCGDTELPWNLAASASPVIEPAT